jgi:hypothetical protein
MEFDPSRALPGVDMIAATEPRWRAVCRTLSLPVEDQPALGQALIVLKGEINTLQRQAFALSADTSDLPPDAMLGVRVIRREDVKRVERRERAASRC